MKHFSLAIAMMLFGSASALAQSLKTVTGQVRNDAGEAIIGAVVSVKGSNTQKTITDIDGNFSLEVPTKGNLEVTYIGCKSKAVTIGAQSNYNIVLQSDVSNLEEVVVVGYGTQKRVNMTGSVAVIDGKEMVKTKNQNIQNMLTGKVAGVRVIQKTSEPGEFTNQFDIRGLGSPLVIVDGVPRGNMVRLDANEIESISVLKDASAAIYGVQAANGVVMITTKRGEAGKPKIEYNVYYGIQTPAEQLKTLDAYNRAILMNEKYVRSSSVGGNPTPRYDEQQLEDLRNGTAKSTDWYDAVMRNGAPQQNHNVSVSGGVQDKVNYFVNFAYSDQQGFFRKGAMDYNRYNLRANIEANITKNLVARVRLNGILDEKMRQLKSTFEVFGDLWRTSPEHPVYADPEETRYYHMSDINNPAATIDPEGAGWVQSKNRIFQSSGELEWSIPQLPGLKLKTMFSYDYNESEGNTYKRSYNEYLYNASNGSYDAYPQQVPMSLRRSHGNSYATLWQNQISYERTIADAHHFTVMGVYEERHSLSDGIWAFRYLTLPLPYLYTGSTEDQQGSDNGVSELTRKSWIGRLNYDYMSRYMLEAAFRYDASSKNSPSNRWGLFPSVSLGWRLSEEAFVKNAIPFLDNAKLRLSYGRMGDDGSMTFQWLDGYDYPDAAGNSLNKDFPRGYSFDGTYINSIGFRSVPNQNITWFKYDTYNVGLDADLWGNLFGFSFDMFVRNGYGLLATRSVAVPQTFGSTFSQENINSNRSKGFELELRHRNNVHDFFYEVKGNVAMTRTMWRYREQGNFTNSYNNWRNNSHNRYNDIWWGKEGNGQYEDWDAIRNSPIYVDNVALPGDARFEDWNGDGVIDDLDMHPIATSAAAGSTKYNYPLLNFGLSFSGSWKGFDLSLMFQGSGMSYISYGEQLATPLAWDGNAIKMFLDRWHLENSTADPYDPSAKWISGYYQYGAKGFDSNSDYGIQKGDYLRLKTLELGYTIPKNILRSLGVKNLRVYFSAYNLLTITGVKGMDPEHPSETYGQIYPLNRTYNFGANISF